MPELPEVQTIVNDLNKKIIGHKVVGFWSDTPKAIRNMSVEKFRQEVVGRKILGAHRTGKNIFIDLSGGKTLYIHLKMTGHLLVKGGKMKKKDDFFNEKVNQYIRHRWTLDKGVTVDFSDLRKFAKIVLLDTSNFREYKDIQGLGIDAMSVAFTKSKFRQILEKRKNMPIGVLLMEQNIIAGIGNIYRAEILFEAGVSPFKKISALSQKEIDAIFKQIRAVLKKAIKFRGTSDSDYRDTDGAPGGFQEVLKVYNREGQPCKRKGCPGVVIRNKIKQRSVFHCEKCQK